VQQQLEDAAEGRRQAEAAAATGGTDPAMIQTQMLIAQLQTQVPLICALCSLACSCAQARGPWQVAQKRQEHLDRALPSSGRQDRRHTVSDAIEVETKVCPNPEHALTHNS
jgi:hypothetical protein